MKYEIALEKAKSQKSTKQVADDSNHSQRKMMASADASLHRYCRQHNLDLSTVNKHLCIGSKANTPEMDCYKILRTRILQRTYQKGRNTIMITSILPGEGKTLTSINLALTIAKTQDHTVLLVDADLRRQQVHKYLGLENDSGLADFLNNSLPLDKLIFKSEIEKFTFISGGNPIIDSSELLGSARMQMLVDHLKKRYMDRYVIFDTAPLLSSDDALTLSPWVDGIVLVIESHKTSIKLVQEALGLIPKEKFLGFVLNKHQSNRKKYASYYYR